MQAGLKNFLKLRLITLILMIHDFYVDLCSWLYCAYISFAQRMIDYSWVPTDGVVFARSVQQCTIPTTSADNPNNGDNPDEDSNIESEEKINKNSVEIEIYTDITHLIKMFYIFDSIQSVASLYRWLGKYMNVETTSFVEIIYSRRSILYAARINLNEDRELFNDVEIPHGSMDLDTLPLKWFDMEALVDKKDN